MTRVFDEGLDVFLKKNSICIVDAEGGMVHEVKAV